MPSFITTLEGVLQPAVSQFSALFAELYSPSALVVLSIVLLLASVLWLRISVAILLTVLGLAGYALVEGWDNAFFMLGSEFWGTFTSNSLTTIPMFILMGQIAYYTGLCERLFAAIAVLMGHIRGGFAMATLVACGAFSAICGSNTATAATMTVIALPEMKKYGYDRAFSGGVLAAGATLGVVIPPSVVAIVLGIQTGLSTQKLFVGGIIPGILLTAFFALTVYYIAVKYPHLAPVMPKNTPKNADKATAHTDEVIHASQAGDVQPGTLQNDIIQPGALQPRTLQPKTLQGDIIQAGALQNRHLQEGPLQTAAAYGTAYGTATQAEEGTFPELSRAEAEEAKAAAAKAIPVEAVSPRAALWGVLETTVLFTLVVGGMAAGIFTPGEAGAAGTLLAIATGLVAKKLSFMGFCKSIKDTSRISAMIFFMLAGANVYGKFIVVTRLPNALSDWVSAMTIAPVLVLVIILLIYFIGGMFIDALALLLITLPVFDPLIAGLGFDRLWFCLLLLVVTTLGAVTPPVGASAFVIASMGKIPLDEVFSRTLLFIPAFILCLAIMMLFPELVLWLPDLCSAEL